MRTQGGSESANRVVVALLAALLIVALLLPFWRLGERELYSSHEARAAMNASSVLEGEGVPRLFSGRIETQKPPLFYWLVAATGWMRGEVDEIAVRLPSSLAAVLVVVAVVGIAWRMDRPIVGLLAGLILASGLHFPWIARIGRIDLPLALTVTLAAFGFFLSKASASRRFACLLLAWLCCAIGVLLKGPIGLALPAAIVAAWLLLEGRWPACWEWGEWRRRLAEFGVWWGVPLVLLVCLPVFAWLEHASDGTFFHDFFWHHNVQRGLGGSRLRSHAWWLYLPYLLLYLLPFSPLLLAAFWRRLWADDPLARLGLAWMIGAVVLLSAARFKRADYLLPVYPGAALFLGCVLARRRWLTAGAGAVAALMLVGWVVRIGVSLPDEEPYRDYRPFAASIRRCAPRPNEVVFFRCEAHTLAFRVGRPLASVVEWEQLRERVNRPGVHHVIVPTEMVAECSARLSGNEIEELSSTVAHTEGRHERPLTLLRIRRVDQQPKSIHARTAEIAADR